MSIARRLRRLEQAVNDRCPECQGPWRRGDPVKYVILWGDASAYESHSEADLALCAKLAFWTGADPERIEWMFSESGLSQRSTWRERLRYRRATVARALYGMTEFYDQATRATLLVSKNGDLSGSGSVLLGSPLLWLDERIPEEANKRVTAALCRQGVIEGLNEARPKSSGTFEEFRMALRVYIGAGLRAMKEAQ